MAGLDRVPGLGAFLQARQMGEQTQSREIQGLAQLMQMKQAQDEAPLKQDLLRAQVADTQAKPQDRIDQREMTKALKMQALDNQASRDLFHMQDKLRTATRADEKLHWEQQIGAYNSGLAQQRAAIAAGNYTYNTGGTVAPFQAPVPTPGTPPAAPTPAPAAPGGLASLVRPQPQDAEAVRTSVNAMFPLTAQNQAASEGADIRQRELMPNGGGMLPSSSVLSAPISPVHGGVPAPAMVPPVPTAGAVPAGPGARPLPQKALDKIATDQAKGGDLSTPEAKKNIDFWTEVITQGGQLPPGLARTPEGAALVKEVMKRTSQGETKPIELLSRQAEFMGEKAGQRTLGTRTANIEMASTEAAGLSKLALQASDEWNRTGLKTLNDVEKFAQSRTASPELRRFVAANTSFINAYARAINPQGVGTVADKEHAREMLEVGFSKGDYAAAINQLQAEIRTAQQAPGQVKDAMRERFTGRAPTESAPDLSGQVRAAGHAYEPDKYEYRVVDGKVQRKAK